MKALTIIQPWAFLVATGVKDIENRSWKTNFRGKVLIHCGKKVDPRFQNPDTIFTSKQWDCIHHFNFNFTGNEIMESSAIIGEVEIVDCVQGHESIWAEPGQWHWVLKNAKMYDFAIHNVKGKLSFWEYMAS